MHGQAREPIAQGAQGQGSRSLEVASQPKPQKPQAIQHPAQLQLEIFLAHTFASSTLF